MCSVGLVAIVVGDVESQRQDESEKRLVVGEKLARLHPSCSRPQGPVVDGKNTEDCEASQEGMSNLAEIPSQGERAEQPRTNSPRSTGAADSAIGL